MTISAVKLSGWWPSSEYWLEPELAANAFGHKLILQRPMGLHLTPSSPCNNKFCLKNKRLCIWKNISNLKKRTKRKNCIKNTLNIHYPDLPVANICFMVCALSPHPFSLKHAHAMTEQLPLSPCLHLSGLFVSRQQWPDLGSRFHTSAMGMMWVSGLIDWRAVSDKVLFVWRCQCWENTCQTLNQPCEQDPNLQFFLSFPR